MQMLREQLAAMREAGQGRDGEQEPGEDAPGVETNVAHPRPSRERSWRRTRKPGGGM